LSRQSTSQPFSSINSQRCEPRKPAPPVITARKFDFSSVRISATSRYYPRKSLQQELIRGADSFFAPLWVKKAANMVDAARRRNLSTSRMH
jgi:hypothetical protein